MNIFFLSLNPKTCAIWHCNEHCIKMILEYFQILSTTHRYLDGELYYSKSKNGRKLKRYRLKNKHMEEKLYKATHINHPSVKWARQSRENYKWLYKLTVFLCMEYSRRYKKVHASELRLIECLCCYPKGIPKNISFSAPPLAMPEEYKVTLEIPTIKESIESYRIFYNYSKIKFATWKQNEIPWWITNY